MEVLSYPWEELPPSAQAPWRTRDYLALEKKDQFSLVHEATCRDWPVWIGKLGHSAGISGNILLLQNSWHFVLI